jgi:cell division protease FtsH
MRRFFRSAAFPILIVIVLAFFAQRLISPGEEQNPPTTQEFLANIEDNPTSFDEVTLQPKTQTIKVTETNGDEYSVGYLPETEQTLENTLQRQNIDFTVEGTGGSSFPRFSPTSCPSSSSSPSGSF